MRTEKKTDRPTLVFYSTLAVFSVAVFFALFLRSLSL